MSTAKTWTRSAGLGWVRLGAVAGVLALPVLAVASELSEASEVSGGPRGPADPAGPWASDDRRLSDRRELERFSGVALTERGEFAYREDHEVELERGRVVRSVTRYYDRGGRMIADLVSDYRQSTVAPDYVFRDASGRVREAAERAGAGLQLRGPDGSRRIERGGARPVVVGQGLHQLIRERLGALVAGEEVELDFAIPSRLDTFAFRVRAVDWSRADRVRIEIGLESWLLQLIAPTLTVEYDRAGRLLSYSGVSNLPGPDGAPQRVVIRYSHAAGPPS